MRAPPELAALQGFLATAFRSERPIPEDAKLDEATRMFVAGNDRLTPAEQADIYRDQFWARHIDSLLEDYVGLSVLVGSEAFDAFVRAYLTACPPRHTSLRDLGDRIVAFAEGYGFAPEVRAAAIDMIRYENAIVEVFDGPEPPPLDPKKLAGLDGEALDRARLTLHPLLVRMRLDHPVHTYRIAAKAAADSRAGECHTCDPAPPLAPPPPERLWLALFRSDLVVSYEALEPEAFALLDAIAAGDTLPAACDRVASDLDEESAAALMAKVGPWFQQWTAWGWIVDVTVDPA